MDAVHRQVDHTLTPSGSQQLYDLLRHPSLEVSTVDGRIQRWESIASSPRCLGDIKRCLEPLSKDGGWRAPRLLYGEIPQPTIPAWLFGLLPLALLCSVVAAFLHSEVWWLGTGLVFFLCAIVHQRMAYEIGPELRSLATLRCGVSAVSVRLVGSLV